MNIDEFHKMFAYGPFYEKPPAIGYPMDFDNHTKPRIEERCRKDEQLRIKHELPI